MSQRPIKEQTEKQVEGVVEQVEQEVARTREPWYRVSSRRARIFVIIYLVEFVLFALLAWFVHVHPVNPIDVTITREFQENQSPWLRITMLAVSAFGSIPLLFPTVVLITALIFWRLHLRLEALFIVVLPLVSYLLNILIKLIVNRPRPSAGLVEILQHSSGQSFPSGHVMNYVAYWGCYSRSASSSSKGTAGITMCCSSFPRSSSYWSDLHASTWETTGPAMCWAATCSVDYCWV